MEKEKNRIIIIGGGSHKELGNEIIAKCKKCGKDTTLTNENKKRYKQKGVEVYCNDCGRKILNKTNEPTIVNMPSQAAVDKRFEEIMIQKFIKEFIKKTLYCKKCKAEIGHETQQGVMLNKHNVGFKEPSKSIELKKLGLNIKAIRIDKTEQEKPTEEKPPEKMVS